MDKQILHFTVNEQILVCENPIKISTNKVNYIQANFDLGENWDGFDSVRAVWFNDFNCISTVLDSLGNCVVPFEVMKRKGNVKVNLVGSISEDDVLTDRLTSYPVVAVIVDCTAQITGANTSPITPSEYEQFVAAVHEDAERAEAGATASEQSAQNASDSATSAHNSAESAHDDKIAIEEAIAEVIQQIEDFEQVQVVVNTLPPTSPATSDFTGGVLTLGIPQGVKGDTGNGIQSIRKTGTSGLVDTYTITYTDGQTTTFAVTNGAKGDTGNGITSIEKTSTVGLVDTYTITYTDGTTSTFTVTNGEKGDKGDQGEVSLSELEDATVVQTLSDSTPYNYRRTNNGNGSGTREYDEIVGASVGWNQLVNTTDTSVTIQSGHKYYSNINNVKTIGLSNGTAISINDGTKDNIIDLTLFNSQIADYVYSLEQNTAGSGVAWLKTHFPKLFGSYQPYDAGSIKSVSGLQSHDMRGFNAWDEELELGKINGATGQNGADNTRTRSKNYIPIVPNQTYYFMNELGKDGGHYLTVPFYDADKNYLSYVYNSKTNFTFTTPSNSAYMRFSLYSWYGTTYNHDICINLSDTSINGQYFPYEKHTYPLDSSVTLRGQYKLDNGNLYAVGDVWKSVGEITRNIKEYTFSGNEDWIRYGNTNNWYTLALSDAKYPTAKGMMAGFVSCNSAGGDRVSTNGDMWFQASTAYKRFYICNPNATSVTDMQNLVRGKTIQYDIATPTTETATPYDSPQWCDSKGTEEYVGSELPVGHNTDYPMTMVDCADGLSNGTYEAKLTIANGVKTFTWQSV